MARESTSNSGRLGASGRNRDLRVSGAGNLTGRRFSDWIVMDVIGSGKTCEVYRLRHERSGVIRALKVVRQDRLGGDDAAESLAFEAQALEALDDGAIPKLHKTFKIDNRPALIMDLCPGRTLAAVLEGADEFLRLNAFAVACEVVSYLHHKHWVHDKLTLRRFLVDDTGTLYLTGFGRAKRYGWSTRIFKRKEPMPNPKRETAVFTAPERLEGSRADPRVDVYGLGMMGYHLFTGGSPYLGEDTRAILKERRTNQLEPMAKVAPRFDRALGRAIDRCLADNPRERFNDAIEFAQVVRARVDAIT